MFTYMKDSRCHWFSSWKCDNYSEFQLVGTVSFINSNKTIRCWPLTACNVWKVSLDIFILGTKPPICPFF